MLTSKKKIWAGFAQKEDALPGYTVRFYVYLYDQKDGTNMLHCKSILRPDKLKANIKWTKLIQDIKIHPYISKDN